MITVIEGRMGSGKTLVLAKLAKAEIGRGGRDVYAKAPFAFNGWKEFDLAGFGEIIEMAPYSIYLDGVEGFLGIHSTSTRVNKFMAYLATRKGVDLYLTVANVDMLDRRVRQNIGLRILCEGLVDGHLDLSIRKGSFGKSYSGSLEVEPLMPLITAIGRSYVEEDLVVKFVFDVLEVEERKGK